MPAGHDIPILKNRYEKSVQNSNLAAQAFGFGYLTKKVSIVSLIQGMPTCLIYASAKHYQNISNYLEVMKCTKIRLRNSFGGVGGGGGRGELT